MKLKGINHIFFDLDHTLWDFDKNSALTFEHIFKIHLMDIDVIRFLGIYEPINFNYWKLYRDSDIDKEKLRYGRLRDTFDCMEMSVSDEMIFKLSEDYIEHLTTFGHLFDDALHILEYLKNDYQLHIITNGFNEVQFKKMKVSGIDHYFRTVTDAEIAGVKKPNPIIFEHALKLANALPSESLMIGDNYEADILGALNVGYDAIFFNYRGDESSDPRVKQIQKLSDLKMYL